MLCETRWVEQYNVLLTLKCETFTIFYCIKIIIENVENIILPIERHKVKLGILY